MKGEGEGEGEGEVVTATAAMKEAVKLVEAATRHFRM